MRRLGIMAKFWAAGAVKTRLARSIGEPAAATFHRASLACLLERFARLADERSLAYAPADERPAFELLAGPQWRLEPQSAGDLGQRMQAWFDAGLAAGYGSQLLLGADSPSLPAHYVEQAFEWLESRPVVLGPSADGGYYLVGAAETTPPIFSEIAWSTPRVLDQTVASLNASDMPYTMAPEWYDVDEWADLVRLRRELDGRLAGEPAFDGLRHWFAALPATGGEGPLAGRQGDD